MNNITHFYQLFVHEANHFFHKIAHIAAIVIFLDFVSHLDWLLFDIVLVVNSFSCFWIVNDCAVSPVYSLAVIWFLSINGGYYLTKNSYRVIAAFAAKS